MLGRSENLSPATRSTHFSSNASLATVGTVKVTLYAIYLGKFRVWRRTAVSDQTEWVSSFS